MADATAPRAALVVGVGPALGAAVCRALAADGCAVAGVGRSLGPDAALAQELAGEIAGFRAFAADAADLAAMRAVVAQVEAELGPLEALVYNAARFKFAPFEETSPEEFEAVWRVNCLGAMTSAQAVLPAMAARGRGAAVFTGATASIRGGANFAAFSASKFALRGLVQSLSRTYWPKGVHVAHALIDGRIGGAEASRPFLKDPAEAMSPDEIAQAYLSIINQPRTAWTQEFDLRPFAESF